MYLVSDDYGDFKKIMNYKQLKELLIDELTEKEFLKLYDDDNGDSYWTEWR